MSAVLIIANALACALNVYSFADTGAPINLACAVFSALVTVWLVIKS